MGDLPSMPGRWTHACIADILTSDRRCYPG
jgi:hypothetical protein